MPTYAPIYVTNLTGMAAASALTIPPNESGTTAISLAAL